MAGTLTDAHGIIAIAAGALAVVALLGWAVTARGLRRLRRTQTSLLGAHGEQDLVAHATALQEAFEALKAYVEDASLQLDARLTGVESALQDTFAHRALVRYDAYNELSGHQSLSVAMLDDHQSGIVLSCIHHRDQARVYVKQVIAGRGELELSPEEAEAVRAAVSSDRPDGKVAGPEAGAAA